jgi:hypothetical protein
MFALCVACKQREAPESPTADVRARDSLAALEAVPAQVLSGRFSITMSVLNDTDTQVEVREIGKDDLIFQAVVPHLDRQDEHFADYVPGALLVMTRAGDTNAENWKNDLWKIPLRGEPLRLAEVRQGMLFWVSPSGQRVVLLCDTADAGPTLHLLDATGAKRQRKVLKSLGMESPDQVFAGEDGMFLAGSRRLLHWDFLNDSVDSVEWPEGIVNDYSIQPARALMVGSTLPDPESEESSEEETILYAIELTTGRRRELARSQGQAFEPRWIGRDTVELSDPATSARVRRFVPR